MPSFEDIESGEVDLGTLLSKSLKNALSQTNFRLQLLENEDSEVADADLLIEEVFPSKEAEEYKPSQILNDQTNSLCIACLKGGIVMGCISVSFDFSEDELSMTVHSLAVDKAYRNKKLGSVLLLAAHDIACELEIDSISLISSGYGELLYKSFGFTAMAHRSFESSVPFSKGIINKKIDNFKEINQIKVTEERKLKPTSSHENAQANDGVGVSASASASAGFFDARAAKKIKTSPSTGSQHTATPS